MANEYITQAELKATLGLQSETYADADIDMAREAASRVADAYKQTRFYSAVETRLYTGDPLEDYVEIDDLVSASAVTVDLDGNGSYETTWVEGTDFLLDPTNATLDGGPTRKLVLIPAAGRTFPTYRRSIKIQGTFGWAAVPVVVKMATKILAARYFKRGRETPYAIVTIVGEAAAAAARLPAQDPDVATLLDSIPGARRKLLV